MRRQFFHGLVEHRHRYGHDYGYIDDALGNEQRGLDPC
jgi:hypothetical protein